MSVLQSCLMVFVTATVAGTAEKDVAEAVGLIEIGACVPLLVVVVT